MDYSIKTIKSKHYIQNLIEEGEHEHQDFKYQISDARKIARSISAFANNTGGRLLIGVKDNGNIVGVESDEEIYMIEQAAKMYCRPPQEVDFSIYRVERKNVLKVDIMAAKKRPVMVLEEEKRLKAYYRVADENILADPVHVKIWKSLGSNDGMSYSDKEHAIASCVYKVGILSVEDCMKLTHVSRKSAEDAIVSLCRTGTLAVKYEGGKFFIVPGPESKEV